VKGGERVTKPFDTSLKELFKGYPADLAVLLRVDAGESIQFLPTNFTTNIETDLVIGLGEPLHGVIDLNLQVAWDTETLYRVFCYNALLHRQYRVPVHSIVVLLRSRDNDLRLEQGVRYNVFPERGHMDFVPEVVRIWEWPVEALLTGGLGLLPLAPLGAVPQGTTREEALPAILRRINARLVEEAGTEQGRQLAGWTNVLTGLHFTNEQVRNLVRRSTMIDDILKASSTPDGLVGVFHCEALQRELVRQGKRKFGVPDGATVESVLAILDQERLERLIDALPTVTTWAELLATQ